MFENSFVVVGTIATVDRISAGVRITLSGPGQVKTSASVEIHDAQLAAIVMEPRRGFKPQDVISARGHFSFDPSTKQNVAIVARSGVSRISAARAVARTPAAPTEQNASPPRSPTTPVPVQASVAARPEELTPQGGMFGGVPHQAAQQDAAPQTRSPGGEGFAALPPGFPTDDPLAWPDIPF